MSEIKQFARIRAAQCWERRGKTIHIKDKAIGIAPDYNSTISRPIVNFIEFEDVLEEQSTNQDVFDKVLKPMCDQAVADVNASNSIFICHGQSATGKTQTILGSDGSAEGVLQLSAQYLLEHSVSHNVELQVIESYGKSKRKIRVFDGLRGQEIQRDALNEKGISSFFMWSEKNPGIRRTVKTIRSNLHFGCTARHNQSSKGHVGYILSIRKEDNVKTRVILLDLGSSNNKSKKTGFLALQKHIRFFATGRQLKKYSSDPIQTLLYPFLVDESKPLLMNIMFTFSPSITCAEESRLTLRDVHSITGCRVYPERCCWKKEHLQDPTVRFKNAAQNTILKVKALKQFAYRNPQNLKGQNKELKVIIDNVRQSMAEQQPNELVLDNIAMGTSSQDDELQQERLVNIDEEKEKETQKWMNWYYDELKFAADATRQSLSLDSVADTQRETLDGLLRVIEMELLSIRSSAMMDEAGPEKQNDIVCENMISFDSLGVDDEYLKAERKRLEQYETTLRETLDVLKDVPNNEECLSEEDEWIENELEKIYQELTALENQTDAFHRHSSNIQMAMEKRISEISDTDSAERLAVIINAEDRCESDSISIDILEVMRPRQSSTLAVFWEFCYWFGSLCGCCCKREDISMTVRELQPLLGVNWSGSTAERKMTLKHTDSIKIA